MHSLLFRWVKRCLLSLVAMVLLAALLLAAGNAWVLLSTSRYIHTQLQECRPTDVAIVFGTSHWTRSGLRNPHFHARMRTSARLIADERVQHLLLSGDNRTQAYNEPRAMWRDLYRRGVPADRLTMDFAGFSTYDTMVRARHVFQLEQALLVTQSWHLPRAIFIGRSLGMDVTGCVAEEQPSAGEWRLKVREWLARMATLGDLYLWGREPHFLGPAEPIVLSRDRLPLEPPPVTTDVLIDLEGVRLLYPELPLLGEPARQLEPSAAP
ncbi:MULTISPECIES: SanA/YdcF family protein [Halomonadaceae]|uniref:Vancomycin high temperature exclusion protein n=1 Tax=Halomonas johnsoniae TaxID=502832 RepID=A0ABQ2WQ98_9GAMM|nr:MULTISPECIES: ElyC/SanA/YdcF family protein [Halomonas]ATH78474.1 sanA-like protein [Halomonas hydrothermalis]PJX13648.1 sanA-like protein [Halomonas sp. 141]GGW68186.1 vancomycin high temperature exclusion protein [Halomonas johnsoniae]